MVNAKGILNLETQFTPLTSLAGGALIGLSAIVLMLAHGRIAGISGIISRLLPPSIDKMGATQGLTFVMGLLLSTPLWFTFSDQAPVQSVSNNFVLLGFAGLLVGFGSVLGNGCTSGHGVCGVSRASGRSVVATIIFMSTGFLTVFTLRHVVGG